MAVQKIKSPNFFRRHPILCTLSALVLFGSWGIFVYEKITLEINRHNFMNARVAVATVYSGIVKQVGPPDDSKIVNDCTRSYNEFEGYGSPTCNSDARLIYALGDTLEANTVLKKVQSIISRHQEFKLVKPLSPQIISRLIVDHYSSAASDNYKLGGLNCVVNYVFDTPSETDLKIKDSNKKPLEITIGCFGPARQQYYPLSN